MAGANNVLRATELNFNTIRGNLKNYLRAKPDFTDYDFEGSGLSTLIDLLAYNTYYNAIYTNFIANEMFLDSAQVRNNVVSRAKMLGYTPRSSKGSQATLNLTVSPGTNVSSVIVPANTVFSSGIDGVQYTFVTDKSYTLLQENSYTANTVVIKEGTPTTQRMAVNVANTSQRYILNNKNLDTSSLIVKIQTSSSNNTLTKFSRATDLTEVTANSNVYFIQENEDGLYELIFGDNILGKKPANGSKIKVSYIINNGIDGNGASNFTFSGTIVSNIGNVERAVTTCISNITTTQSSENGDEI